MKKFVAGIIIGAFLMFSGQALAEVGKKIQAEYDVIVDGKKLDKKAIASAGVTYTPNRALADAVGYDIKFTDKAVHFTKKEGAASVITNPEGEASTIDVGNHTLESISIAIKDTEASIKSSTILYRADPPTDQAGIDEWNKRFDELNKRLENFKAIKTELESRQ